MTIRKMKALIKDIIGAAGLILLDVFVFKYEKSHPFIPRFMSWLVLLIAVFVIGITVYNWIGEFLYAQCE